MPSSAAALARSQVAGRILIIHSNRSFAGFVGHLLVQRRPGVQVAIVTNTAAAWNSFFAESPDLVLLDARVPDNNSLELCDLMSKLSPAIRFIVAAPGGLSMPVVSAAYHLVAVLRPPFSTHTLLELMSDRRNIPPDSPWDLTAPPSPIVRATRPHETLERALHYLLSNLHALDHDLENDNASQERVIEKLNNKLRALVELASWACDTTRHRRRRQDDDTVERWRGVDPYELKNRLASLLATLHAMRSDLNESSIEPELLRTLARDYLRRLIGIATEACATLVVGE